MNQQDDVFAPVRARLLLQKQARFRYGALNQDFECKEGEIFYSNLTPQEFDALPLQSKRKGGPAHTTRLFFEEVAEAKDMSRVFSIPYAEFKKKDKDSTSVFVAKFELDFYGIEY